MSPAPMWDQRSNQKGANDTALVLLAVSCRIHKASLPGADLRKHLRLTRSWCILVYMSTSIRVHRQRLQSWRDIYAQRDQRIIDAYSAGISVTEIHRVMGVSRMHIYKVLGREQQSCQKTAS